MLNELKAMDWKRKLMVGVLLLVVGWIGIEIFNSANAGRSSSNDIRDAAEEMRRIQERNSQ